VYSLSHLKNNHILLNTDRRWSYNRHISYNTHHLSLNTLPVFDEHYDKVFYYLIRMRNISIIPIPRKNWLILDTFEIISSNTKGISYVRESL